MAASHVPLRTCVGCRGRATKTNLVRIVGSSTGEAALDITGSAPGRGAYVHRSSRCVELAFARGRLVRALGGGVSAERAATLRANIEANIEEEPPA